ncbi:MAG: hypothetical protein RBU37_16790 [Myxococcota bacterium]|jgi:hypothetical protein|nr:hypothetical protein [Myxococcota bacterium]
MPERQSSYLLVEPREGQLNWRRTWRGKLRLWIRLFLLVSVSILGATSIVFLPDFISDSAKFGSGYVSFFIGYLLLAATGAGFASASWLALRPESFELDVRGRRLRWTRRSLAGRDEETWPLKSIKAFVLEKPNFFLGQTSVWVLFDDGAMRQCAKGEGEEMRALHERLERTLRR